MVQTVRTTSMLAGEKIILFEKPLALCRVFFSVRVMARPEMWYETRISFDDPKFSSFYMVNGSEKYFEAKGADICQGDIWAYNKSEVSLTYALTEILH